MRGHRCRWQGRRLAAGLTSLVLAGPAHAAAPPIPAMRAPLSRIAVAAPRGSGACRPLLPLRTQPAGPHPFDVVADGVTGRVFVATTSGVRVLDGTSGRLLAIARVGTSPGVGPGTLADDPQTGRVFVTAAAATDAVTHAPGQVAQLDGANGALLHTTVVGHVPTTVAVDGPTRRVFVVAYRSDSVSILDADRSTVVHTTPIAQPLDVVVDTRTQHAFVTSYRGTVTMLDARSGAVLAVSPVGPDPRGLAVEEPGGRVFVTAVGGLSRRLVVLDARSGALLQRLAVGTTPTAVAVNGATRRLFVAGAGTVRVLDARQLTLLGQVPLAAAPVPIALVAADTGPVLALVLGSTVVAGVASGRGQVGVLDGTSGRLLSAFPVGETPGALALQGQSQTLFVVNTGANTVDVVHLAPC